MLYFIVIQKCTFLKIIIISQYGYQSAYLEVNPTVVMSVTKGNIFEFLSDMTCKINERLTVFLLVCRQIPGFFFASCTAHIWLKFFHETNKHSLWTVKYRGKIKKDSNTVQLSQYRHQRTCHSVHIVGVFVISGLSDKTSWTHVLMIETLKQTVLQGNVKL